jgi:hypothetical protein
MMGVALLRGLLQGDIAASLLSVCVLMSRLWVLTRRHVREQVQRAS